MSLAGPVMNFIIAFLSLVLCMLFAVYGGEDSAFAQTGFLLCYYSVQMNIGLGVFNLIPFPPLDGSKILLSFLPDKLCYAILRRERLIALVMVGLTVLGVFTPVLNF